MGKFISFEILGNQSDRNGNPIPYFRSTQNSQWSDGARRYEAWKKYVQCALYDQYPEYGPRIATGKKPIVLERHQTAEVSIYVDFVGNVHGDLDNILKGINDALFEDYAVPLPSLR